MSISFTLPPLQVLLPPSWQRLWMTLELKMRMGWLNWRAVLREMKLTMMGKAYMPRPSAALGWGSGQDPRKSDCVASPSVIHTEPVLCF